MAHDMKGLGKVWDEGGGWRGSPSRQGMRPEGDHEEREVTGDVRKRMSAGRGSEAEQSK